MSDETKTLETVAADSEDKLFRMMADQQDELNKFRENANARLAVLERSRARRSGSFMDLDFGSFAGLALAVVFGLILLRVAFMALSLYEKRQLNNGNFPMSEA